MNQNILNFLKNYSYSLYDVNRLLVSAFLNLNEIKNVKNLFLKKYIVTESDVAEHYILDEFLSCFLNKRFDIEDLLQLFEFVISPEDKEVNGAVFTPKFIREYIVKQCILNYKASNNSIREAKFSDIACGCGGFFETISMFLKKETGKTFYEIFKQNIFGVDIKSYSIERSKILLTLLAISNGEDRLAFKFNLYTGNSLQFDWLLIKEIKKNRGFDIIVGNPPYVGSSKIDEENKILLKKWKVSLSGKADLYIPFFEIALSNLNEKGFLGFITVNSFYKSLNGRALRNYFSSNGFGINIIDFGDEQVFKGRSTYTCICVICKMPSSFVKYVKVKSDKINLIKAEDFISFSYEDLNDYKGWYLINYKVRQAINTIENTGTPLGKLFEIRNGFATLKNNIYLFKEARQDLKYFYFTKGLIEYKIEKDICRDAIKPNTLKNESEIDGHIEKLIFPYFIDESTNDQVKKKISIIDVKTLKARYPYAYDYLQTNKGILATRDKSDGSYEEWYAFGRNQALTLSGYKLLLPYITNKPCFVYTDKLDLLFYNGYAVISENSIKLKILEKILMSNIFWFYIINTSKPYAGNYFSQAKNYIKNFGICDLTEEEELRLLNFDDKSEIDQFLVKKYGVEIS